MLCVLKKYNLLSENSIMEFQWCSNICWEFSQFYFSLRRIRYFCSLRLKQFRKHWLKVVIHFQLYLSEKMPKLNMKHKQGGYEKNSPMYELLARYFFEKLKRNLRYYFLKVCAWNWDDLKEYNCLDYGYIETLSKISNGKTVN